MKKKLKRIVVFLLVSLFLIPTVTTVTKTETSAATQLNVSEGKAVKWALDNYENVTGSYQTDPNKGDYIGECVSLVKNYIYYALDLKTQFSIPAAWLSNGEYVGAAKNLDQTKFIKDNFTILNREITTIQPGDIWVTRSGVYGHTGIVTSIDENNGTFNSVEWNGDPKPNDHQASAKPRKFSDCQYIIRPQFIPKPEGSVDIKTYGNGSIDIYGWAYDPNYIDNNININVYIGGPEGTEGAEVITIKANKDRHENGKTVDDHGIHTLIYPETKSGTQPIYVYAIGLDELNNKLIESTTLDIGA